MLLRNILFLAVSLLLPSSGLAAHLDLAWHPNEEPNLAGYTVYWGISSGDYTDWIHAGDATSVRITGLSEDREYFFTLTAYDFSGNESAFSAEVSGYALPDDLPNDGADAGSTSGDSSSESGCFITSTDWRPRAR